MATNILPLRNISLRGAKCYLPPPQTEKSAWRCTLIGTVIYLLAFFPLLGTSLCLVGIALDGQSLLSKIWVTAMYPAITLSMPASIYFMWRSYLSILHADYSTMRSSVQVAIFNDRMEITNPGPLPLGLSLETALS